MNIGEKAFRELFPRKELPEISIKYSRRFKDYNANITYTSEKIQFSFADEWKEVSEDIQIGLAQHLLRRIHKNKEKTINIELYEKFLEHLPKYVQNQETDFHPELIESYNRVNEEYFNGFLDMPALEWGSYSTTQLGTYSYHTDTVRLSTIFQGLDIEHEWYLDYVMYHELLHKKFGLKHEGGSCRHHSPEFRAEEKKFRITDAEKLLTKFVNEARRNKPEPQQPTLFQVMRNIFK